MTFLHFSLWACARYSSITDTENAFLLLNYLNKEAIRRGSYAEAFLVNKPKSKPANASRSPNENAQDSQSQIANQTLSNSQSDDLPIYFCTLSIQVFPSSCLQNGPCHFWFDAVPFKWIFTLINSYNFSSASIYLFHIPRVF